MKAGRILLFIASIIAALAAVGAAFPANGVEVAGHHIGFASLHTLVAREEKVVIDQPPAEPPEMTLLRDSVAYYRSLVEEGDLRFWLPDKHYLDAFWKNLERARRDERTIRVLHYGDSQIEMDHISSRLRSYLQQRFGGGGPGMVPFHSITPSMSIRQGNIGELTHLSSFGDSTVVRSRGDYGPMMQCFRLNGGSAGTTLRASKLSTADERIKHFSQVTLLFNNRGSRLNATLNDRQNKSTQQMSTTNKGIASFVMPLDSASNSVRISVTGSADLYGVLLDDGVGVAVDNIPMRGCSGQQFTLIPFEKLCAAYEQMDVGLIILQFGGNSVPYLKTSNQISTYCQSIGRQLDHLHLCCPTAKLLFVGPSDMSTRLRGQLQTYPAIPELIDSLAATATQHGAAFWSIYHAMGGHNSMPEWTRQGLAGQDYIHFSQRGADLMGDRLSQALDNSYRLYRLERKMNREKKKVKQEPGERRKKR